MDPMEKLIADALDAIGADYVTGDGGGNPSGLDFRLASGVEIEVKRFHSDRIADQMSRAENVIVAQGKDAVEFLAALIRGDSAVVPTEAMLEAEAEWKRAFMENFKASLQRPSVLGK